MRLFGEHNSESLAHNTQRNSTASARNKDMFGDTMAGCSPVAEYYLDNCRHLPLLSTHFIPSNVSLRLPLQLRVNHALFDQDTTPLNLDSNRLHLTILSTPK